MIYSRNKFIFSLAIAVLTATEVKAIETQPSSHSQTPFQTAGLFDVIRIVDDVDDLIDGDYRSITPVKRIEREVEDAFDDVDDVIDDVEDVVDIFDDDIDLDLDLDIDDEIRHTRRRARRINRRVDRIADDVDDWFD